MSEKIKTLSHETRFRRPLREVAAIGAATLAFAAPAVYVGLQKDSQHEQRAAGQMVELYGEEAIAGGLIIAGQRYRQVMAEHEQSQKDQTHLPPLSQ